MPISAVLIKSINFLLISNKINENNISGHLGSINKHQNRARNCDCDQKLSAGD